MINLKKISNKKSQLYGLSAFIYAIAIAVMLIVGVMGISKDYQTRSTAGQYRFYSVVATKNAQIVKSLLDQERSFVVDKALYFTGAYGGYNPYSEMFYTRNCSAYGCDDGASCNLCPDSYEEETVYCSHDLGGKCVYEEDGVEIPVSVDDGVKVYIEKLEDCGIRNVDTSFVPEKRLPYWSGSDCIPPPSRLENVFKTLAGDLLGEPDQRIIMPLQAGSDEIRTFNYKMKLNRFNDDGVIDVNWLPLGVDELRISIPPRPEAPVVDYSFSVFAKTVKETQFFDIYEKAVQIAEGEMDSKMVRNLPGKVGFSVKTGEVNSSGTYENINPVDYNPFKGLAGHIFKSDAEKYGTAAEIVTDYGVASFGGICSETTSVCEGFDSEGGPGSVGGERVDVRECIEDIISSTTKKDYPTTCTANVKVDDKITITEFVGCDSGDTLEDSYDDKVMKCIVSRVAYMKGNEFLAESEEEEFVVKTLPVEFNISLNSMSTKTKEYKTNCRDLDPVDVDTPFPITAAGTAPETPDPEDFPDLPEQGDSGTVGWVDDSMDYDDDGWTDCSETVGGVDMAREFCKCEGYDEIYDNGNNACYNSYITPGNLGGWISEPYPIRWSLEISDNCEYSQVDGTQSWGQATTIIKCGQEGETE